MKKIIAGNNAYKRASVTENIDNFLQKLNNKMHFKRQKTLLFINESIFHDNVI